MPQAVLNALAAQAPDFTPWALDLYPTSARAQARTSPDAGMSVVRGPFRSPSAIDYVIAGFDRRLHGIRIVAVLAEGGEEFKVLSVSDGPERADSLAMVPDRYLETAPSTSAAGTADLLVKPVASATLARPERYAWVPDRRQFLVVSPNH